MRIGAGAKIKLDFTDDLYDHMIEEINEYLVQVNQRIEKRGQRIVNRL